MEYFPVILCLLMAAFVTGQVEVSPRVVVARVGGSVNVLCKVAYKVSQCRWRIGGQYISLTPEIPKPGEATAYYYGNGLDRGECGATITNIAEDYNGNLTCMLPPPSGGFDLTADIKLIVAKAPKDIKLVEPQEQQTKNVFNEGDVFQTTCMAIGSRPAANLSWYLGDRQIFDELQREEIYVNATTDLVDITQSLRRPLTADDSGLKLTCLVGHPAMEAPFQVSRQLNVQYGPKSMDGDAITIFGLKIGESGQLNVTVRANPQPRVEWTVMGQRLLEGESDTSGNYVVPRINLLGAGYYNVSLLINTVAKEDVDKTYYLDVTNPYGTEHFTVRISTMDEPAGVELDAGAIVGIVVGVLVLLIAVFLIVFAKATDRWCFAGGLRRRDNQPKNSGESSDTESAVGGARAERSRLAELSARVRSVLPKRGRQDKVQATAEIPPTDTEEKPLAESEKKGIVYAELSLADQPGTKPAPESTEYAEIVYTNPPTEQKPAEP